MPRLSAVGIFGLQAGEDVKDAFAKRSDKLTKGEQKQLEDEVKVYIDAEEKGQLVFISK